MKRWLAVIMTIVISLSLAVPDVQAQGGGNLLANPSFEGAYAVQDGQTTIIVAPEWRGFWKDGGGLPDWASQGASAGPIRKPEYKAATLAVDSRRVRTGGAAQCLFTFYGVMLGGVRQTVPVEKGSSYQASAWVQAWTDGSDDPCKSTGQMVASVGIDSLGGSDPWARGVVWQTWRDANPGCGKWYEVKSPVVMAEADHVTVYILFDHRWALKHGDGYLDDAALRKVSGVTEPVPVCPTPTPGPSGDCLTKGEFDTGVAYMLHQVEVLLARLTLILH